MAKKGFTLVELMVVVGILSIIMLTISQPVANVIKYQKESQSVDNVRDNLQFIINKMEKELKTSSNATIDNINSTLTFTDQNNGSVIYSLDLSNNKIKRGSDDFTDPSVLKVTNLKFWNNPTNKLLTILIEAESIDGKDRTTMQSSVYPLNNLE